MTVTRAEYCVLACAEAWRGDGEVLAAPMGLVPRLGARLARLTFAPDLLLTDGEALLVGADDETVEGWLPYRRHLALVSGGRRHVMMGASQLDAHGNQNISCVGDWKQPRRQLLGVRGAPVNTLNNPTSYWVPRHSPRVFVERVDMVCGVGYDRPPPPVPPRPLPPHPPRGDRSRGARLRDAGPHPAGALPAPGRPRERVREATGFPLAVADDVPATREPTAEELRLIREVIDPAGLRDAGGTALMDTAPMDTALTRLVGVRHPIVQTGMGWVAGPRLVSATADAGALGILASATMSPERLRSAVREVASRTEAPFGVNLRADAGDAAERVRIIIEEGVRVASFALAPQA